MSVDEQLLGRSGREEAAERSGDLRQSQRQRLIDGKERLIDGKRSLIEEKEEEKAASLREKTLAAKRIKQQQEKKEDQVKQITPFRKSTSELLRQSWLNLIDSFGLTLIWINIHVFLNKVIGEKFFCELGDEWMDKAPAGVRQSISGVKKVKIVNMAEKMGLGFLDLILFILIFMVLVLVALLLDVLNNPLSSVIKFIWHWVAGTGFVSR